MLPFDMVAPSTPLFGVPRNMKEMKMCRWAVCSIDCIWTSESGTLFPFSFSRSSRATLSAVSAVHSLVKAPKTTLKHQNSLKSVFELQHESTAASLSCLHGYYSNMASRTVKRAIPWVSCVSFRQINEHGWHISSIRLPDLCLPVDLIAFWFSSRVKE